MIEQPIRVAVIATVLNERDSLPRWLQALEAQTSAPDEVVIVDGGSTDGTLDMLRAWSPSFPVRVIFAPGANIAAGRNTAIDSSVCEIVAVTDAGTVADANWLSALRLAFGDPLVDVASGFFVATPAQVWDTVLASTTLPDFDEIRAETFLPSSRSVAIRKGWFDAGIAYPEWLDYCEDLVLDLALKRAGARFILAPEAVVTFEVRPDLRSHVLQYYRYARGDGKAGLFARRHLLRYGTYLAAIVILRRHRPAELVTAGVLAILYLHRPFSRLLKKESFQRSGPRQRMMMLCCLPFVRLSGDVAKMCGYPLGITWRIRRFGRRGWRINWKQIGPHDVMPRP